MSSRKNNDIELNVSGSVSKEVESAPATYTTASNETYVEEITEQNIDEQQDLKPLSQEDIDQLVKDIFNTGFVEKELQEIASTPTYILDSKDAHVWLYSLTKNTFLKVSNKAQIISIDNVTEHTSHCLINNDLYEVKNDMIKCVGWN